MAADITAPEGIPVYRYCSRFTTVLSLATLAILIVVLAAGSGALAQDEMLEAAADEGQIEEIIVTGSRIKRRDFVTPSPLTTIDRDDIAFSGQSTIEETLNQMPQIAPSFGRTSNNPGSGTSEVDLRSFGPNRTLTLLNGRRIGGHGSGSAVDLNNIPQFLIERVEIITGGTSAVYGSDAIAGVVNFITRDDFEGFGIETSMSMAEPGDAETYDLNLAYGTPFADGRGNLVLFGNLFERKELMSSARPFSSVAYFDDWEGNLVESGSSRIPEGVIYWPRADLGDGPVQVMFNPDGTPREFVWDESYYNYAPANYLQVPLERRAFGLFGQYQFTGGLEAYFEASLALNESSKRLAPVPAQLYVEINLDNPVLVPETRQLFADYYGCAPNLACVVLGRRMSELGHRDGTYDNDFVRVVAGLRGDIWNDWEFDAWVVYSDYSSIFGRNNGASRSRIEQGLLVDPVTGECYDPSDGCVPVNLFGAGNLSPEAADFIRVPPWENADDTQTLMTSAFVTGSPLETWAGSLDTAFGIEWRSTETRVRPDTSIDPNDTLAWGIGPPVHGTDEVFEVYAEAVIPLAADMAWADYLGLEIGGRYSEYKHAGGVWTYKAGAEWRPNDTLKLRAMRQHSVRAPDSGELFTEQSLVTWQIGLDPCSVEEDPIGNGNAEKCILQGLPADQVGVFEASERYPVDFLSGGNPDLEPESADTWTAGFVVTPSSLPNLTLSIDYFEVELTDTIGGIDAMLICFSPVNTANVFCENIERDTTGNVSQITEYTSNRGLMETSGVDTQIQFGLELPGWLALGGHSADLAATVYWTHLRSHKVQENVATEVIECAGYYGWPCWGSDATDTFAENRVTSNFHYTSGAVDLHLTWRWIEGSDSGAPLGSAAWGVPDPILAIPKVDDQQYFDVGIAYEFSDAIRARFGINNLLDNDPPLMADQQWGTNSDYGMYDVFGRSYYLTLSAQF